MADMIMDDRACFVVGEAAWHRKGVRLDMPPSTPDALRLAGLDWHVHKKPLYARLDGQDGLSIHRQYVPAPAFATVRYDAENHPHVLGVVGRKYEVLQNDEAFSVFDRALIDRGCVYESAGAVRDGRRVWILARLPESITVADDEVRRYFLLVLSHDGSTPLLLRPTPVRVVCNNTLNLALRGKEAQFSLKHLRGIRERLEQVMEAIGQAEMDFDRAREEMERMAETPLPDPTPYFMAVMPDLRKWNDDRLRRNVWRNRMLQLTDLYAVGKGNHGRTVWDAYNAITEWVDHVRPAKEWVESTQFGTGGEIKRQAFAVAADMAMEKPSSFPAGRSSLN